MTPRQPGQPLSPGSPAARTGALPGEGGLVAEHARIAEVRRRLQWAGVEVAQEARWLVEAASDDAGVDAARLDDLVGRRLRGEPLQVVVGATQFRHVTVGCRSGVFVPRPETEVVAGVAVEALRSWPVDERRAVDLCTGTGAIALALASEVPGAHVCAVERDRRAVELARRNVDDLGARVGPGPWRPGDHLSPGARVEVRPGDLFAPVPAGWAGGIALVVANPPYLPGSDRGTWSTEVADHDPEAALVGGPDGHEVVDAILVAAASWLAPGGTVVVEVDERRAGAALDTARDAGLVGTHVVADLAGRDRAVVGRRRTDRTSG